MSSFLNTKPAGKNGQIITRDGHFVESDTGERIRFFGTNVGGPEIFAADPSDFPSYARHLAKHGINGVRIHHLDNTWASSSGHSLWSQEPGPRVIDPERLKDMHAFIDACVAEGIYINFNLKVSKELTAADGMPASVSDIEFSHQKRIDRFYEPMIQHQIGFAKEILNSTNAAGVRLADNPGLMTIEINNENSLVGWHYSPPGTGLQDIPEPFKGALQGLWNDWLTAKYANDAALRTAWSASDKFKGESAVRPSATWSGATQGPELDVVAEGDAAALVATVDGVTNVDWHGQALLNGINVSNGQTYTLRFDARAEPARKMRVTLDDAGGNGNLGLETTLDVTPTLNNFELVLNVTVAGADDAVLALQLGDKLGTLAVKNLRMIRGVIGSVPPDGQSLVDGTIGYDRLRSPAMAADWVDFVIETDAAFTNRMTKLLRDDLGVVAPILDTQVNWGGITGYHREKNIDVIDTHEYWEHPQFPGGQWDPADWTVGQESFVSHLADNRRNAIAAAALVRQAGKPFSISEIDHPAPNGYRSEMMPVGMTFAAHQDWDAFYTFTAGNFGKREEAAGHTDRIASFFDNGGDPSKFGFYASTALLFRGEIIEPNPRTVTLQLPPEPWKIATTQHAHWSRLKPLSSESALSARWQVDPEAGVDEPKLLETGTASDANVRILKAKAGDVYIADSSAGFAISGFVGGDTFEVDSGTVEFAASDTNHASATVVALDRESIQSSARLLVTVVGRAENIGMTWNKDRTSVSTGWGKGPVHCEPITATFKLARDKAAKVYALDPAGRRKQEVEATFAEGMLSFRLTPSLATIWLEVVDE